MALRERNSRLIAKAASWRMVATCDTILLSWVFTGALGVAFKIGISEVVTKIALFYLHERIWQRLSFGTYSDGHGIRERHYRSIVKGMSWRIFGTMDTILLAFFWTGDYSKAFAIGAVELVTKIGLFWLHERAWLKVHWGRKDMTTSAVSLHN